MSFDMKIIGNNIHMYLIMIYRMLSIIESMAGLLYCNISINLQYNTEKAEKKFSG